MGQVGAIVLRIVLFSAGLAAGILLVPDDLKRFGAFADPTGSGVPVLVIGYAATLIGVIAGAGYRETQALQQEEGGSVIVSFRAFAGRLFRSFDLWKGLFGSPVVYVLILKAIDGVNLVGLLAIALENGFFCTIVIDELTQNKQKARSTRRARKPTLGPPATNPAEGEPAK